MCMYHLSRAWGEARDLAVILPEAKKLVDDILQAGTTARLVALKDVAPKSGH